MRQRRRGNHQRGLASAARRSVRPRQRGRARGSGSRSRQGFELEKTERDRHGWSAFKYAARRATIRCSVWRLSSRSLFMRLSDAVIASAFSVRASSEDVSE
eukprot:4963914-Prymnesium_polylepis.2